MKPIKLFLMNILLYIFGTAFLKRIRSRLRFVKNMVCSRNKNERFVKENIFMLEKLKLHAQEIHRPDFVAALDECKKILDKDYLM